MLCPCNLLHGWQLRRTTIPSPLCESYHKVIQEKTRPRVGLVGILSGLIFTVKSRPLPGFFLSGRDSDPRKSQKKTPPQMGQNL